MQSVGFLMMGLIYINFSVTDQGGLLVCWLTVQQESIQQIILNQVLYLHRVRPNQGVTIHAGMMLQYIQHLFRVRPDRGVTIQAGFVR